jgi:CubicO group peptidase (beta-lactamase class C family)
MKKTVLWIAADIVVLALFALGQTSAQKATPLTPAEEMDKLFDFWNRLDQPGFAVVVVKEGQVVYQKVFGLAGQEHAAAITPNTVFNVATLAQPFVGQAVAMLEDQGKLALDDDVRKFIPEVPDFGTPIRVRHLLYHSSGLRDWLPVVQLTGRDREEMTMDKVLKIVKAQKQLLFPPGERSQYSNTDYDLLAETIKRATGKPFSDWAWENVFRPLKMTRTQFRDNSRSIFDDEALSYNFTRREYLRGIDNLSMAGSHSLFTSIADLAKWLLSIDASRAGGPDIFTRMFKAGTLADGKTSAFGYGLNVGSDAGRRQVSQTGTWAGSGGNLVYFPDQRFGFAVLANWDYTSVDGFAPDIIGIYLPAVAVPAVKAAPAQKARKSVKVSQAVMGRYAGDYRMGPGRTVTIGYAGDRLTISFSGQKFPLTTLSETEFLLDIAQANIVFQKDKGGNVHQFVFKQGGAEQIFPRVVLVKPTAQELAEFAGAYFNEELDLLLALEVRGNGLVLISPAQGDVPLNPDEQDHFATGSRPFPMIVFRRDSQNRVTGFIIDSDAVRDLVFARKS